MKSALVLLALLPLATAEVPRLLPPGATKGDVVRDYGAQGDGIADDTAAIQKALDDRHRIVWLPPGTYRISDTLRWGKDEKRQTLEGAGPGRSIIRLADRTPGFGDAARPKSMVWTGKAPAQRFRNAVRSLSLHAGDGNPGAIGLQFIANNQGGVFDVEIRGGTPAGPIGLDLGYTNEQGPMLAQGISVTGFRVGVSLRHGVDSVTMEDLLLEGQEEVGLRNAGQCLSLHSLRSTNRVPAVDNGPGGVLALVEADCTGGATAAVVNRGMLFLRGLRCPGTTRAVDEGPNRPGLAGGSVSEWRSHPVRALWPGPARSLALPVERPPSAPWAEPQDWVSVRSFPPRRVMVPGARGPDGGGVSGDDGKDREVEDWSQAFQAAIDTGAACIFFPPGSYEMHGSVELRGAVRRVFGGEASFGRHGRLELSTSATAGPLRIERFDWFYSRITVRHRGPAPLTLASLILGQDELPGGVIVRNPVIKEAGSGDLFLEDVSLHPGGRLVLEGGRTWARQLNIEGGGGRVPEGERGRDHPDYDGVLNRGGQLWILGIKSEGDGTLITTLAGGRTEVLGGFAYANKAYRPEKQWFAVHDAELSFTLGESVMRKAPFDPVWERRGDEVRIWNKGRSNYRGGSSFALFSTQRFAQALRPPEALAEVRAEPGPGDTLTLRWQGGTGAESIAVELGREGDPLQLACLCDPAAGSQILDGLPTNVAWRVRLMPWNGAGAGPAADLAIGIRAPATGTDLR